MSERELRIIGSNYGSTIPADDFPALVDLYLAGDLMLDELVSGRRPLRIAEAALQDLGPGAPCARCSFRRLARTGV